MKKTRKLALHRETLRVLDSVNLANVGGGATFGCPNTSVCTASAACSFGCSADPGCGGTNNCGSETRTTNEN